MCVYGSRRVQQYFASWFADDELGIGHSRVVKNARAGDKVDLKGAGGVRRRHDGLICDPKE